MKKDEAVLVLVIHPENVERLLEAGQKMATRKNHPLRLLSILPKEEAGQIDCGERIDRLFAQAIQAQADVTVLFHDQAASAAADFIHAQGISCVVVGKPSEKSESRFLRKLRKACPYLPIYIIEPTDEPDGNPLYTEAIEGYAFSQPLLAISHT